ncbi:MAG: DUF3307 domain-containing protein [Pseudomonadota bacterium]
MFETFIVLLFAHLIGDFVTQSKWIVEQKNRSDVLFAHVAMHLALTAVFLGNMTSIPLAVIGVTHFAFDFAKARWGRGFSGFVVDQIGHVAVLIGVAIAFPTLYADGIWSEASGLVPSDLGTLAANLYLPTLVVGSGLVATLLAARFGIEIFMTSFTLDPSGQEDAGLPEGGLYIGLLERALVFLFVMIGQFTAIGFLIAAKSVLRFGVANDRKMSEYVIIGTLMSFGWAIATASLTRIGLDALG